VRRTKPQEPPRDMQPLWPYVVLLGFGIVITLMLVVVGAEKFGEAWGL
jgi:hypothetical protein